MKVKLKQLPSKIKPFLRRMTRFVPLLLIVLFVAIYGFLVLRIDSLAAREPGDAEILEQLQSVHRPKIDSEAAHKIEQLRAQNIDVRALFNEARRNPFAE